MAMTAKSRRRAVIAAIVLGLLVVAPSVDAQQIENDMPKPPPLNIDAGKAGSTIVLPESLKVDPETEEACRKLEESGDKLPLACQGHKLGRRATSVPPVGNNPPLSVQSPDVKIGIQNETAIRQQYGKNYGKSVVPDRPTLRP
jgi:hypothetical protein